MSKILIVDDDPAVKTLIERLMALKGHEWVAAESGKAALDIIDFEIFDLIITDLRMQNMDGMELLRKVRRLTPNIPVIMVTAYSSTDTTLAAVQLGVFDYLAKPFKVDDLNAAVEQALAAGKGKTRAADQYTGNNPTIKAYLARQAGVRPAQQTPAS